MTTLKALRNTAALAALLFASGAPASWAGDAAAAATANSAAPNPFAAHNAYPWRLYGKDRFDRALKSGLKHIEVDVTYDPARKAIVATHDTRPNGKEAELGELLGPLWSQWGSGSDDGYTLIIDFKSASPELVGALQAVLEPHANLLSSMPKSGGDFRPGKITVCLTGSGEAHRMYADLIPGDGRYLAFSDVGFGGGNWEENVADYIPRESPGFTRFLTFEFHNFLDAPRTNGLDHVSLSRLRETVKLANEKGYRIRIYTINPPSRGDGYDTRFWDACAEAGVHMISTDAYEQARDYWAARGSNEP
jgi:hypothetical protein